MFSVLRSGSACFLLAAFSLTIFFGSADAAGPKAYVGNFKDNTVSVIDTAAGSVVATIPVGAGPHGMAVSADGRSVYVSNDGSSTVNVIDTAADRVTRTIEVGKTPHGLALAPRGSPLLVAVNGEDRIAFVDTSAQAVTASVSVPKPHTIAVRPDGKTAYVASQEPGHFALVVVDLTGRTVLRTITLDKAPRDLEFGHDGKSLYFTKAGVNAVEVLDPASDRIVAAIPTGASPHYANVFRNAAFGTAVVQGPGELLLFDPQGNKPLRSIKVGKQPHWIAVSDDGKTAYVPNEGSNDVSVVDLASGKTSTITVGNQPRKVVVQPTVSGAKVSIENFAFVPPIVTVGPDESVAWRNNDGSPHVLAFRDGTPGSGSLLPGETYSRTFGRPGEYDYFCSAHPFMTGRVLVRSR